MSRLVELVGFETTEDAILHIRTTIPDRDFGVDSDTTVGSNKPAVAVLNASSASAGKSGISGVVAQEIFGDALNNVLTGTSTNDVISGRDGADNISGGAGDDTLYGHSTADLSPASGNIQATLLANIGGGAVFLTGAPGDNGFAYALNKDTGQIFRINTATGARTEFLDIPDGQFAAGGEQGVLGLAFHPGYAGNGRFFVFLTNAAGNLEVREYHGSGNPPTADAGSFTTVITIPHPVNSNHNGGCMAFGPDGSLYIATGDGGGANDPNGNGQNLNSLLGKILRINVNGDDFPADPTRNYAIPGGNPFAGATPGADEIWDYGLRNPWRISFDSATGDLYIGDVGQGAREEINFEPAGGNGGFNYGWDFREGRIPTPGRRRLRRVHSYRPGFRLPTPVRPVDYRRLRLPRTRCRAARRLFLRRFCHRAPDDAACAQRVGSRLHRSYGTCHGRRTRRHLVLRHRQCRPSLRRHAVRQHLSARSGRCGGRRRDRLDGGAGDDTPFRWHAQRCADRRNRQRRADRRA